MQPSIVPTSSCPRSQRLLRHHPLVRRTAMRLHARLPASVQLDDLMQVGMIGLHEAISRFDASPATCLETFAARRVAGAMFDSLRADDPLPRPERRRQKQLQAARERAAHQLGRTPQHREVAQVLGWSLDEYHRQLMAGPDHKLPAALERRSSDEHGYGWVKPPETTGCCDSDPMQLLLRRQRVEALVATVQTLDQRDRRVMQLLYVEGMTMREIGSALGVGASRVSQIHDRIVALLRLRLREW